MKIAILTFHNSDNYGSVLQAYALRTYIIKQFNPENCDIVNFVPPNQEELYAIYLPNDSFKNIIKNMRSLCFSKLLRKRKAAFTEFRNDFLNIKAPKMYTQEEVDEALKGYDVLVCGSDQIWNPRSLDFSPVYFGINFGGKKISYAPSFGNASLESFEKNAIWAKESIESFSALSVREEAGYKLISELGINKPISKVLDPTFLLEKDDWANLLNDSKKRESYIFFYSIDYNVEAIEMVKSISKKTGLKVKVIFSTNKTYRTIGKGIELINEVSPRDFLTVLYNADIVLSSSFHGVAFSVLFRKNFYALESYRNGKKYEDERIHTILGKIDLLDRIVSKDNINDIIFDRNILPPFNEDLIREEVAKSRNYIVENLS